ncbi:phosphatidylcholine-hydrolyzing phospholipase c [Diplodia corticola]|uniref:Phosphatidylcholine-hydrolyzing phospholipase c n=1 Tax=Diplodia corticola TaxID=236234 RepID=A0A1J9QXD3_9PEZI|nr:phosphatidylcholine-hydrolyzing phospholipase c [Diplodia corticola]OJD33041.1 phosphatidylcholine-hydrolyzing phospholipase c [Diplodia corticola]
MPDPAAVGTIVIRFLITRIQHLEIHTDLPANSSSSVDEDETVTMECVEYAEHSWLGDAICLSLEDGRRIVAKTRPIALPNGLNLTYGEINGLAGDFYGTTKPISDGIGADEQMRRFVDAYRKLSTDTTRQPGEAERILSVLQKEVDAVNKALANHEDPSVAYSKLPDETCTFQKITSSRPSDDQPSYIGLALINWDHFGEDARTTYNAGHAKALEEAAKGNLMDAYALNAFADHFLEDSFSAGHLRTPRRMLHGYKGVKDFLAKYMHDEDCAIGLSVTNPAGESWQAFGDKRLLAKENKDNKERCLVAIQASADEVFQAYKDGKAPSPDSYKAWTHACTLDSAHGSQELAPLFKKDEYRRKDVTHRREWEFTQDWWVWSTAMKIWKSGWWKYPITIDGPRKWF